MRMKYSIAITYYSSVIIDNLLLNVLAYCPKTGRGVVEVVAVMVVGRGRVTGKQAKGKGF